MNGDIVKVFTSKKWRIGKIIYEHSVFIVDVTNNKKLEYGRTSIIENLIEVIRQYIRKSRVVRGVIELEEDIKNYKLGSTIQEFEELFGNTPFEDIEKIKKYIFNNYIPKSKVKEKIEELNNVNNAEALEDLMNRKNYTITELVQYVLQELLRKE